MDRPVPVPACHLSPSRSLPRSPAEGAATRSVADLEVGLRRATRDRRVRSGQDRRQRDLGPPNGIERRQFDRRSHDRRVPGRHDRRRGERRGTENRRAAADHRVALARRKQAARLASRSYDPQTFGTTRTPRLLRVIVITIVAVACLLAATLTERADAAAAAAVPGVVKASAGKVSATLSYQRRNASGKLKVYGKLRLTVRSGKKTVLKSVALRGEAKESWITRPSLKLADVNGDATVDAIVQTFTGGAHCCSVSAIAPSTDSGWAKPFTRNWADFGYELKNLDDTPQLEFKASDARFTAAYGPYAATRVPIQIFRVEGTGFVDVTRQFPDWIKQDRDERAKDWQESATFDADARALAGRNAAAAWIADLLLLGDVAGAKAVVDASAARGDFAGDEGKWFPGQLGHDLKAWGYLTDPTTIGLTDTPAPMPMP